MRRRYTRVVHAEALLRRYADPVDVRLDVLLTPREDEPPTLFDAMRYAVLSPGKRVRPALAMASAQAVGADPMKALDAGCAIEFVHCFSLIHDDLPAIDNDDLRRGRPTCHKQFGEAMAILAGDALFALAFECLAHGMPPSSSAAALRELARASGPRGLVGGEVADVLAEGVQVTGDEVRRIHERKTGALIEAACVIGALAAEATSEQVETLRAFGRRAGLAFQISDDLLNELSTAGTLGKSAGSDRERRKATYPSAFGIETSSKIAHQEADAAIAALESLSAPAEDLRVFARFVVERLS